MTDKVFDVMFDHLIGSEGNYVNDPRDPGGETKFGICKKSYPNLDIKNLTLEDAKEIFRKDFWLKCNCDKLPDCISIVLSDFAYNAGVTVAKKTLQNVLGLTADGIFGPKTFGAVDVIKCDVKELVNFLLQYQTDRLFYYKSLKTWKTYGNGWSCRVLNNLSFAKDYLR